MDADTLRYRRRTDDAGLAIRQALLQGRLLPDAATRWLLALSRVARDRQSRFAGGPPHRRAEDA